MKNLEPKNHRVDSTWWKQLKDSNWIKYLINPEWDIREINEWNYKWEQYFTYNALIRLWLEKRLPTYEDIKGLDNPILAGYWYPYNEKFNHIGERANVWLAGGDDAGFYQNEWGRLNNTRNFGFSGRLLKELDQSDTSSISLFEQIVLRAENNWVKLWAKAGYDLGKILYSSIQEND